MGKGPRPSVQTHINENRTAQDATRKFQTELLAWDPNATMTSDERDRIDRHFNARSGSSSSTSGGDGGKTGGGSKNIIAATLEGVGSLIETQQSKTGEYLPQLESQLMGIGDVMKLLTDGQGKLNSLQSIGEKIIGMAAQSMKNYYTEQRILLEEVNSKAMITGQLSKDFRETITSANPRLVQLGIGFDELASSAIIAVEESGRMALVNQGTLEKAGEVGKAYVGSMKEMVAMYDEFEKVGIGAKDANLSIERAGKRTMELGLNSKKVVTDIQTNMGKLNEYGFKNGIDGLSAMARKATEFRMSMDGVFKIAEDVMDPEKALALTANLQVLGGAIGDFNDPLKMMYMATNNVEGLQDALIGAAGSLATYNSEQGRFEITGVNLRKAKEMANQMGISYQQLAQGAIAAAERSSAASDMMARGLNLKPEQTEFLTNIARMKDGKMVIDLGQSKELMNMFGAQEVALDQLTDEKAQKLLEYQNELKEKTTEDIARGQASNIENIRRDVNYIALLARNQAGRMGIELADKLGVGPMNQEKLAKSTQQESKVGGYMATTFVKEVGNTVLGGVDEFKNYFKLDDKNKPKENTGTMNVKIENTQALAKSIVDEQEIRVSNKNPKTGSQNLTVVNDPLNKNSYFVQ
jgi:hypothetical protein